MRCIPPCRQGSDVRRLPEFVKQRVTARLPCTHYVELREDDVGGIAVHITARVIGVANPGEILVSRTVRDLVVGSDVTLEDRGMYLPKGIDGDWQLLAVARP
jgi:class 3 adenylate cyclase